MKSDYATFELLRQNHPSLTPDERALFDELRDNRLGPQVRLEQERIRFGRLQEALGQLGQHARSLVRNDS